MNKMMAPSFHGISSSLFGEWPFESVAFALFINWDRIRAYLRWE